MSQLTTVEDAIIGTPEEARQNILNIAYFVSTNAHYQPSDKFNDDMAKLQDEIVKLHTHGEEGFFIFTTELIDAVLNRAYPYLVKQSLEDNTKITLERMEELTEDETPIVIYSVEVENNIEDVPTPIEGEEANISPNPFMRPPGIDSPIIPNPLGTPLEGAYPRFDGRPYDPLDPLNRDLHPMVPRTPQIAALPEQTAPIRQKPPTVIGGITDLPLNTGDEIPSLDDEEEDEEPEDGDGEPIDEDELQQKNAGILQRILEAIIGQGQRTRQSIADLNYAVDLQLGEIETAIDEVVPGFEGAITKIFFETEQTSDLIEKETRDFLLDMFDKQVELSDSIHDNTVEAIDKLFDGIVDIVENPGDAIDATIDTAGELISDAFTFSVGLLVDAVTDTTKAILWAGEQYLTAAERTIGFMSNAVDMEGVDITDWICQFFEMIKNIKDNCSVFKEGNI